MLSQLLFVATYVAVVSAQIEFLNGTIVCSGPGDFCSGNIIIRCGSEGIGQPGNCDDNLAGEPPIGVGNSNCWETSPTSGDAACSKNCKVYCGSGNCPEDFTLPDCLPIGVASSSASPPSTIISNSASPSTTTRVLLPASSSTNTLTSTSNADTSTSIPVSTSPNPNSSGTSSSNGGTAVPNASTAGRSSKTPEPSSGTSTSGSGSITTGSSPSAPSVPSKQGGLSTTAKAVIGVGTGLGVLLVLSLCTFAFWYGRRSATRRREEVTKSKVLESSELEPGIPIRRELADTGVLLTTDEKGELERRRRAAELGGNLVDPVELSSERAELQALREIGNAPVEKE